MAKPPSLLLSVFTTLLAVNSSCQQAGTKLAAHKQSPRPTSKQLVDQHEAVLLTSAHRRIRRRTPRRSTNVDYEKTQGFSDEIQKLDKTKPLVYCRPVAVRRRHAANERRRLLNVTNLDGVNRWWQNGGCR